MDDPVLERHLRIEANRALERGALYALFLGLAAAVVVPALMALGAAEDLELAMGFALACSAACAALWRLARRRQLHGPLAWSVMLGFTSLPTAFFLVTHALLPAGAATFLNGPIPLLYAVMLAVTGSLFDARLSIAAGLVAAAGFLCVSLLALPELQQIQAADPRLRQDLVTFPIYAIKAMMIAFTGLVVGALAVVGRRLARRVLVEEREKQAVDRLLGVYVSAEVAERLRRDQAAGERKEVVVLFSDIRGFTTFSEHAEPEEIVERLNAYFDAMVDAIGRHGGIVDKFIGDAVMAVFGGVVELDAPAEAALAAARDMRAALDALNARWAAEGRAPFDTGIGLHVGEVVLGSIGSAERKDFTVIGDPVNTAARLEGLTRAHGCPILVSGELADRLPPEVREGLRDLGTVTVKGRRAEVRLLGTGAPVPVA